MSGRLTTASVVAVLTMLFSVDAAFGQRERCCAAQAEDCRRDVSIDRIVCNNDCSQAHNDDLEESAQHPTQACVFVAQILAARCARHCDQVAARHLFFCALRNIQCIREGTDGPGCEPTRTLTPTRTPTPPTS
jgi:hypothetical protein